MGLRAWDFGLWTLDFGLRAWDFRPRIAFIPPKPINTAAADQVYQESFGLVVHRVAGEHARGMKVFGRLPQKLVTRRAGVLLEIAFALDMPVPHRELEPVFDSQIADKFLVLLAFPPAQAVIKMRDNEPVVEFFRCREFVQGEQKADRIGAAGNGRDIDAAGSGRSRRRQSVMKFRTKIIHRGI